MPLPPDLAAALASPDAARVSDAAKLCLKELRSGEGDGAAIGEALQPLAAHRDARVRKPVADACTFLPDAIADRILPPLLDDTDAFVKEAAIVASGRIARRRATEARRVGKERRHAELYAEIGAKDGAGARARAERAARGANEDFGMLVRHEVTKVLTPMGVGLARADAELGKPRPNLALVQREIAKARQDIAILGAIVASHGARFREERLAPLLEKAAEDQRDRLGREASRLRMTVDIPPSLAVEADARALLQAFQNVLQNAAEAFGDGATITIHVGATALRDGAQVALAFRDEGPGMTEDERAQLFVPHRSRKRDGSGLGLGIARMMIEELHGGTLSVESAVGRGTTVTIVLPVRRGGA